MSEVSQGAGDPWLGRLPAGWSIKRLGALGTLEKGRGGSKEDNRDAGVPVVRYGDLYTRFDTTISEPTAFVSEEDAKRYTPLPMHSLVFAASGESAEDIGKSAMSLLAEPAVVGGDAVVFHPHPEVDPLFLAYALESAPVRAFKQIRSTGFTVVHISAGKLKTLPIPVPPHAGQRTIANHLDRETARIDTLIDEQQRLITMLRERRRSVASDVLGVRVGRGERLKWVFDEVDSRAGVEVESLPLMSVSISWGVRRRDEVTDTEGRAEDLSNYKVCRRGDLVVNRMRAFQGALGLAAEDGLVSPDYAVLRFRPEVAGPWLAAAMKTDAFVSEMSRRVKGIGSTDLGNARTPRINVSDIAEIRVDAPSLGTQMLEVGHLAEQTAKIDQLIGETERFIELSKERRSALITAAVTGQIDVGGVA